MSRWLQIALQAEEPKPLPDTLQEPAKRSEGIYEQSAPDTLQEPAERGLTQPITQNGGLLQVLAGCREDNLEKTTAPTAWATKHPDMRHGFTIGGRALTWTGKVVRLEDWRHLTEWDKHGPDGRRWNALTQDWEKPDE